MYVRSGEEWKTRLRPTLLGFGVPQGCVLGPILFLLYTAGIIGLIHEHDLLHHLYADDTQVYVFCHPDQTAGLCQQIRACVRDVAKWMSANRMQLDLDVAKTEFLWCSSRHLPVLPILISGNSVDSASVVRDLESGLTAVCQCPRTSPRSSQAVLQHSSFSHPGVAHGTRSVDWITAMLFLLDCAHTSSIGFSLLSMQQLQLARSTELLGMIASRHC